MVDNRHLYKDMYLRYLGPTQDELDFKKEVKEFSFFKHLLESDDAELKTTHLPFLAKKVSDYLFHSSPNQGSSRTVSILSQIWNNKLTRKSLLCNSSLFQRVRLNAADPTSDQNLRYTLSYGQRQASAKLHSLYGVPLSTDNTVLARTSPAVEARTYPYAVSKVYDLRTYTDGTFWGPFQDDGQATADWEKIEAILVVLGHNIYLLRDSVSRRMRAICSSIWQEPWEDMVRNSCTARHTPRLEEPGLSLDARDPYGVTGTYLRVVCFLDYSELFTYNFDNPRQPPAQIPLPPLASIEAIRMITMDLKVTKITPPGEDDGEDYPVVHFRGTSKSVDSGSNDSNANSGLRGTVRQTREGEIRWTTHSIYHGEERWKSESIQIGGIRSARGAIGNWFDKDYDIHGPAGPTAFWKVSPEVCEMMREAWMEEKAKEEEYDSEMDDAASEDENEDEDNDEEEVVDVKMTFGDLDWGH